MSRNFEVDSDLDLEADGVELDETDFDEPFEFEDFAAMGIDPIKPTAARPGSEQKVLMLSARYAAGLPLWHSDDCYDHGPGENQLMGNGSDTLLQDEEVHFDLDEDEEVEGAVD